ncbi:uncharacterized protein LOC117289558 [Asterias rubens]|uniref:uncharacterized protein LOC117289558 n=1 Tax=Asterias rubens TaxID=7604 RepID=UPI0014553BD8|nr:uncharacterized protein LOC117289558 [Asterias rubens]
MRLSPLMLITFLAIFCLPAISTYRIIPFVEYCPQPGCTILDDRSGELKLNFSEITYFRQCALVFAAPYYRNKVFLRLVSDPEDCHGFSLHVYDGRTYSTKHELSIGGICTQNTNSSVPHSKFRSFMTSGREFSMVLEKKRGVALGEKRVVFTLYYRVFDREEHLLQEICHMCRENHTRESENSVCEGLMPNCTGIDAVVKGTCLSEYADKLVRSKRTEAFGILMSGAVIFTIIFVALHCGGSPPIKVRPTVPAETGGRHTTANAMFAGRAARAPGPVGHV